MLTWRARGIAAGVVLALLALAYLAGRRSAPAKVVTRDVVRVETQTRDVVKTQVVHDVQTVHDTATQVRTVTVTRWAKAPDGSPVVTQETHQESATEAHATKAAETKATTAAEHDARQVAQETRTVTVTAERPQWSVTALAGASLGSPPRLVPGLPAPLVVGVALERRILGPLSAGLWATSSGAGGVSVRFEF
jgi:hypothetical protein